MECAREEVCEVALVRCLPGLLALLSESLEAAQLTVAPGSDFALQGLQLRSLSSIIGRETFVEDAFQLLYSVSGSRLQM